MSKIITFILGGASIYFFYEYNFFLAVLFLVWFISRLFGYNLSKLIEGFGEITKISTSEKKSNCTIELKFNIEEILKDKIFDQLFEKLSKKKDFKFKNKEDWANQIIANYKKKFKKDQPLEEVRFNIKNNMLWKNGEIDFNDSIYHEITIPYKYEQNEEEDDFFTSHIDETLTIRVFVVNGIIKLQVGNFSKEFSPEVIKKGLDVYKTHHTLSSFPLMYSTQDIPESYLNLSMYATNSYYEHLKGTDKDFTKDWKEINKEMRDYNYIFGLDDNEEIKNMNKFTKIVKYFNEKKENWIKEQGFKNPFARDEGEDDYFASEFLRDNNIFYTNKSLSVFVANHNDNKGKREKYAYTDYWEEMP